MEYPKMLYRHGGPDKIEGERFTTLVVNDADEAGRAAEDGFRTTTTEALAERADTVAVAQGASAAGVAAEVDKLKASLEEGLKKLDTERAALQDATDRLQAERDKVDADTLAVSEAITQLELDRVALKEGREALDADRKAFDAEKAAAAKPGKK